MAEVKAGSPETPRLPEVARRVMEGETVVSVGRADGDLIYIMLTPNEAENLNKFFRLINAKKVKRSQYGPCGPCLRCTSNRIIGCCTHRLTSYAFCSCFVKPCVGEKKFSRFQSGVGKITAAILVDPGLEYWWLAHIPGWGHMAGKIRLWASTVYPAVGIHDELGRALSFNLGIYTLPVALFVAANYWGHSVPYPMILAEKGIHDTIIPKLCLPRCCEARNYFLPDWEHVEPSDRTNTKLHRFANFLNFASTTGLLAAEGGLYLETLKTKFDLVRHGVSAPFYFVWEFVELFSQNQETSDRVINKRIYKNEKANIRRDRMDEILSNSLNAMLFFAASEDSILNKDDIDTLNKFVFYFKSGRSKLRGKTHPSDYLLSLAAISRMFSLGQQWEFLIKLSHVDKLISMRAQRKNSRGNSFRARMSLKRNVTRQATNTGTGFKDEKQRILEMQRDFLNQSLDVLSVGEELRFAELVCQVYGITPRTDLRDDIVVSEAQAQSVDSLKILHIDKTRTRPEGYNSPRGIQAYWKYVHKEFLEKSTSLSKIENEVQEEIKKRKKLREKNRTRANKTARKLFPHTPGETLQTSVVRGSSSFTLGAAAGGVLAYTVMHSLTQTVAQSFGNSSEDSENIANIVAPLAALGGSFACGALSASSFKPSHILESGVRTFIRGSSRMISLASSPAAWVGFAYSIAGIGRTMRLFGKDDEEILDYERENWDDLYTLGGLSAYGNQTSLNNPHELGTFLRSELQLGYLLGVPLGLLTVRLAYTYLSERALGLYDSVTGYKYQKLSNQPTDDIYALMHSEKFWKVSNILFFGPWWSATFLTGVYLPACKAFGMSEGLSIATAMVAYLGRSAFESKLVEEFWFRVGLWAESGCCFSRVTPEGRGKCRTCWDSFWCSRCSCFQRSCSKGSMCKRQPTEKMKRIANSVKTASVVRRYRNYIRRRAPDATIYALWDWIKPQPTIDLEM